MKKIFIIFYFFVLNFIPSFSQLGSHNLFDTRSMGMGNGGNANTDNFQSFLRNPALLYSAEDSSKLIMSLAGFNLQAYTNTITVDEFNYYFNHKESDRLVMNESDKNKLINNFTGNGNVVENLQINYLTLNLLINPSIGGIGISIYDQVSTKLIIPKEIVELFLNGNELNRTYSFNDLSMQNWITRTIQLSYSRSLIENISGIKALKAGISAKIINGFGYSKFQLEDAFVRTNKDYNISGNYSAKAFGSYADELGNIDPFGKPPTSKDLSAMPTSKSSGLGFDIGFLGEFESGLKIGLSINEIGSITWKDNPQQYNYSHSFIVNDILNQKQIDSLTNGGKEVKVPLTEFKTTLPTNIRFGVSMPLDSITLSLKGLTAHFDLNQGFNDNFLNNSVTRYAFGFEWKPSAGFRLASGISNDYAGNLHLSLGTGLKLGFFEFNLATLDILSLIKTSNHASIGLNMCFYLWRR